MVKQLLIYQNAVPVSASRHRDAAVEPDTGFAFASQVPAVPLMAAEFQAAASEYAIVFAPVGDDTLPVAVLGLQKAQNLFIGEDDRWRAKYVPAFIRRYPFVFATGPDRQRLVLCIDEACAGFNREGRGQALFDADGKPSAYTQRVLKFQQSFKAHFQRTRAFCQRLKEAELLEPMGVRVGLNDGQKATLGGFTVASRTKLRELPAPTLAEMIKGDELELLYLHLHSLRHFGDMRDRLGDHGSPALDSTEPDPHETAH